MLLLRAATFTQATQETMISLSEPLPSCVEEAMIGMTTSEPFLAEATVPNGQALSKSLVGWDLLGSNDHAVDSACRKRYWRSVISGQLFVHNCRKCC